VLEQSKNSQQTDTATVNDDMRTGACFEDSLTADKTCALYTYFTLVASLHYRQSTLLQDI